MNQVPPSATMTASEPSVRKDCRCFLCQKVRPEVAVGYQDPFCGHRLLPQSLRRSRPLADKERTRMTLPE